MKKISMALLLIMCLLVGAAPTQALAQTGDPFIFPSAGATYDPGEVTEVTVDFTGAEPDSVWCLSMSNDSYGYESIEPCVINDEPDDPIWTWQLPEGATQETGSYSLILWWQSPDGSVPGPSMGFEVENPPPPPPPLEVRTRDVADFFPTVQDGYRDRTAFEYKPNRRANHEIRIRRTETGQVIYEEALGVKRAGYWLTWRWDGRDNGGSLVPAGRYSIELESMVDAENLVSIEGVSALTDVVTKRASKERVGYETSARSRTGGCYIRPKAWSHNDIFLDCWGGGSATATYNFRLPQGAFDVRLVINASQRCCSEGDISREKHISSDLAQAKVTVTGWRALVIWYVKASWSFKKRI